MNMGSEMLKGALRSQGKRTTSSATEPCWWTSQLTDRSMGLRQGTLLKPEHDSDARDQGPAWPSAHRVWTPRNKKRRMMGGDGAKYTPPPPPKARTNMSGMWDSNRPPFASSTPTLRRKNRRGRQSGEQRVTYVLEEENVFQEGISPAAAAQLQTLTTSLCTSTGVTPASEEHLPRKASAVKAKPDDPMDSDLSDYDNETSAMCAELTCGPIGAQEDGLSVLSSPVGVRYFAAAAVREDEVLEMAVVMGRVSIASVDWIGGEQGRASGPPDESVIRPEVRSAAPIQTRTCHGHQQEPSDGTLLQPEEGLQRNHGPQHPPVDMLSVRDAVSSEKNEPCLSVNKQSCGKSSSTQWPRNIPWSPPTLPRALPLTLTGTLGASPRRLSRSLEDVLPVLSPMSSSCPCVRGPSHCSPSLSEDNREVEQEGSSPVSDGVPPLRSEGSERDSTATDPITDVQASSTTDTSPGPEQIEHNLNPIVVAHLGQDRATLPFAFSSGKKHHNRFKASEYNRFTGYQGCRGRGTRGDTVPPLVSVCSKKD